MKTKETYRLFLKELTDGQGATSVLLFFEYEGKILRVLRHSVEESEKTETIAQCFQEMAKYIRYELQKKKETQ